MPHGRVLRVLCCKHLGRPPATFVRSPFFPPLAARSFCDTSGYVYELLPNTLSNTKTATANLIRNLDEAGETRREGTLDPHERHTPSTTHKCRYNVHHLSLLFCETDKVPFGSFVSPPLLILSFLPISPTVAQVPFCGEVPPPFSFSPSFLSPVKSLCVFARAISFWSCLPVSPSPFHITLYFSPTCTALAARDR